MGYSRAPLLLVIVLALYLNLFTGGQVMAMSDQEANGEDEGDASDSSLLALNDEDSNGGILWENVAFSQGKRVILEPCSFHVENGRVCALLGPSGAGKTTLLKSLASVLKHEGHVYLYDKTDNDEDSNDQTTLHLTSLHHHANRIAWLQQQDHFFERLTVTETLELAAYFELPHLSSNERQNIVSNLMDGLGLHQSDFNNNTAEYKSIRSKSRNTNRPTSVLSGGERRRLSVALELLSSEDIRVLLADEPTTGLDSGRSERVVGLIRNLAKERNVPALLTLHQPRSSIWNSLLDDCILMADGGRVCYAGTTDDCLSYFANLGFHCPPATNPAEFIIDLVSVDTEDAKQELLDRARVDELAAAFRKHQEIERIRQEKQSHRSKKQVAVVMEQVNGNSRPVSFMPRRGPLHWIPRFAALVRRSWRQNSRAHAINAFRLVASAGNAMLLAQIFPTVRGKIATANSVADRVALLSFGAINMCMLAFMKTVELFAKEKPVIQREQRRNQYTALEYLVAKGLAELPLDIGFACIFTTVLKLASGIRISWGRVSAVFSLMTAAGASLGFLMGSWAPSGPLAQQAGIPILVILMVVGIINPSGSSASIEIPWYLRALKLVSPFTHSIESLCLGEYPGMQFLKQGLLGRMGNLRMGGLAFVRNGDQVIDALGLQGKTFEGTMKQLAMLTAANFFLSWVGLMFHGYYDNPRHVEQPPQQRNQQTAVPRASALPLAVPIRTRL
ncbi:hypothetical protein MPSEU_000444100 [Mayamaea pseudoterrestris]|nr:hypothetical protein MPSEU_000444100 [Mayamaea pseudoterrestris]